MTNEFKKEMEETMRRIYNEKSLAELKRIGKKEDLLNVDQYKKANKKDLVERLVKGRQLSDNNKDVLLEIAQTKKDLKVNASMSKKVILQKITNPKLTDLSEKRLREIAKDKGVPLRSQMTNKAIIQRLENPTDYYTVESLKRLARSKKIDVRRNISKPELINILGERNLITTKPITVQESNLGYFESIIPIPLIESGKKKARSAKEALQNLKEYIESLKLYDISANRLKKLSKQLERKEKKEKEERDKIFTPILEASAFKNYTNQYGIYNNIKAPYTPKEFLEYSKPVILNIFKSNRNIKTMLYLHCIMSRDQGYDEEDEGYDDVKFGNRRKTAKFAFHSKGLKLVLEGTDISELYNEMADEIEEEIQKVNEDEGSGWTLVGVISLVLHTTRWEPIYGSSYIPLDPYIANKKAIINMKNEDDKCFMWCVLRALYPKNDHPERIDKDLKSKQDIINMKGICYPVSLKAIDHFEHLNPNISISVLGYNKEDRVFPLRISKYTGCDNDIVLLLLKEAEKGENGEIKEKTHYTLVKNKSALIASQKNNHKGKRHLCLNCFNSFNILESLNKHKEYCYENNSVKITMPPQNTYLRFKNFHHSEKAPFAVYADFESLIKPLNNCDPDPNKSYTKKYQKHEPISFSYYIAVNGDFFKPVLRKYTKTKPEDADAMDIFIKWLEEDVKDIANIEPKEMIFTEEDIKHFNNASDCWICGEELGNDRVRDHCHFTGRYRGPAHNSCNLKYRKPKNISVFFHNLSGYDSHLFIKKLGTPDKNENIDCIPNNEEKYISFSKTIVTGQYTNKKGEVKYKTFKIVFKDSLKFMSSSLGVLVNNLPKDAFKNLLNYFTPKQAEILKQKGFYPYEYMDSEEKFNDTKLPPREAFYSNLSGKGITEKDYKHAGDVWNSFKMKTFKEYHELYNITDVLLLADVFENFRDLCLKIYGLDPVYYFTAPGLAWDACLKITDIDLELLNDPNMLLMFEKGIRGGISIISNRYGEANNKYMRKGFNKNKPSKYLMYLDANNLYGCAMSEKLPTHGFKWLSCGEMEKLFNNRVIQVWEKIPCILEVDLEYPENLHDLHNDYPFCPERVKCKNGVEKLIPNLNDKTKYIIHYKNLIQCLRAGIKLKKIHRGIKFVESEWMKPYIDKNTNLRAMAKNNFEKDFFKLMNNSVFGKTMENIRNRVDVKLVNTKEKLRKLVAKPNLRSPPKIFSENLVSVHMRKTSLTMNKPIYLGMCILELSKIIMFDFHYNYIKSKYADKAKLLFTDTDSLMYEIQTEDFYKDISGDVKDKFDTSDYPENHPSGIPTGENKKVLGMMKDEVAGKIIKEFVGLRSKLYSFVMDDGGETKKCKGIKKQVVERSIMHEHYKTCLKTGKELLRKQNILRSYNHEVYTEEVNKVALSALDDKRYILSDGMDTLALGHYKIKDN